MIFRNIGTLLTLEGVLKKQGRHIQESDLSILSKAAMIVEKGKVLWIGSDKKIPKVWSQKKQKEIDLDGETVLPGFVECHTHLIHEGSRASEFELRNQGVSYQDIAARGGGILSTMKKTRKASRSQLVQTAIPRVKKFISQGVTSLEIKTGYALDLKNEIKCLEVITDLQSVFPSLNLVSTYLGAHAKPPEFLNTPDYLNFILEKVLPLINKKKLSTRVDLFVEKGFFEASAVRHFVDQVRILGFDLTVHADQLSLSGGSDLAVEFGALSADHVIQIQDSEVQKLSRSNVTCVLLPAADLYMKCAYPPARNLLDSGARVALATDFNPGSSPTQDLALVGLLARLEMKMSLPEVIAAYTYNASCALKSNLYRGALVPTYSADFISIKKDWTDLFYFVGESLPTKVYSNGIKLF